MDTGVTALPGVLDGKLCALTDDKGTVGKIDSVTRRTNPQNRGAKIILFSTSKLVQHMFQEHVEISEDEMVNLISQEESGNIPLIHGCIHEVDFDYIKGRKLGYLDVANYTDGWYSCLLYVETFSMFDKSAIQQSYTDIIHISNNLG